MKAHRQVAFTMVELVVILVVLGILAVTIMPRFFDRTVFETRGFYDQALAMLRYAQRLAVAQRRVVYVSLDGTTETISLCYANTFPCSVPANQVTGPNNEKPYSITARSGTNLATSLTFFFDAKGRPYNSTDPVPTDSSSTSTFVTTTVTITGGNDIYTITVQNESGYVH